MNLKQRANKNLSDTSHGEKRPKIMSIDLDSGKTPKVSKAYSNNRNRSTRNSFLQKLSFFSKKHKFFSCFVLLLFACGVLYQINLENLRKGGFRIGFFDPVKTVIGALSSDEDALKDLNQTNGRTNFLIIGIDRREENESLLTDSLMIMSYDHNSKNITQISFPRDLEATYEVNSLTYVTKINEVFTHAYYGSNSENQNDIYNDSFKKLGEVLDDISGLESHYGVMINFNGLKDVINSLDGIEIDVEREFIDCEYPNESEVGFEEAYTKKLELGCSSSLVNDDGYMALHFNEGLQQMDGAVALRYARSRHGNNGEGSDFARAKRQQKVVQGIIQKAKGSSIFTKLSGLDQLSAIIGNNFQFYNIGGGELNTLVKAREAFTDITMNSVVVDPSLGSYPAQILGEKSDGAYKVYPLAGDYSEVRDLINFYLLNSYILSEDAKVELVFTSQDRYQDYLNIKDVLLDKKLKFSFIDYQIADPEMTPSTTVSEDNSVESVTIYKINEGKDQTLNYYQNLLTENGYSVEIKDKEALSEKFLDAVEEQDLIITLE